MAFGGGTDTKLYINGYDLTAFFRNSDTQRSAGAYDTSVYGVGSKQYIAGLKDGRVSLDGIFDGDAAANDAVLAAALGVNDAILLRYPQGDALGNAGQGCAGIVVGHNSQAPVDGVVSNMAEIQASKAGVERVKSLLALSTLSAGTTNGTSIDDAAGSTAGASGFVEATAVGGGFTTATIKIQHSTDNAVWVDLITFTAITAARAKERLTVTGTVNRYIRHTTTATGGTITATVAFHRN